MNGSLGLAYSPILIAIVALATAGTASAQASRSYLGDLAFSLGQSHALRQLCEGPEDQYWRTRMTRLIELEGAKDEAVRVSLAERFNDGFRASRQQFSQCTAQSRAAERSVAARGRVVAGQMANLGFR